MRIWCSVFLNNSGPIWGDSLLDSIHYFHVHSACLSLVVCENRRGVLVVLRCVQRILLEVCSVPANWCRLKNMWCSYRWERHICCCHVRATQGPTVLHRLSLATSTDDGWRLSLSSAVVVITALKGTNACMLSSY